MNDGPENIFMILCSPQLILAIAEDYYATAPI